MNAIQAVKPANVQVPRANVAAAEDLPRQFGREFDRAAAAPARSDQSGATVDNQLPPAQGEEHSAEPHGEYEESCDAPCGVDGAVSIEHAAFPNGEHDAPDEILVVDGSTLEIDATGEQDAGVNNEVQGDADYDVDAEVAAVEAALIAQVSAEVVEEPVTAARQVAGPADAKPLQADKAGAAPVVEQPAGDVVPPTNIKPDTNNDEGGPSPDANDGAAVEQTTRGESRPRGGEVAFSQANSQATNATPTETATPQASAAPAPIRGESSPTAAVAPAVEALPSGDAAEQDANVARVMRGMQGVVKQDGGSVTLRLKPPELGVVRVQMEVEAGVVRAQLFTERESVRDLLSHRLTQLRAALESQGLSVDRLEVQAAPQGQQAQWNQQHASQQQRGDAGPDGRSRGFSQQNQSSPRDGRGAAQQSTFEQELVNTLA